MFVIKNEVKGTYVSNYVSSSIVLKKHISVVETGRKELALKFSSEVDANNQVARFGKNKDDYRVIQC